MHGTINPRCDEEFYREFVYWDSKFKNALGKPQPSEIEKVAKPVGYIPPADKRKYDPWARPWDAPRFESCVFIPAVCEGALCGGDVAARAIRKIGSYKTYEQLIEAAQTTPAEFRAHMRHSSFYFRWQFARASYADMRSKPTCGPDGTYMQEAGVAADRFLEFIIHELRKTGEWQGGSPPDQAFDLSVIDEALRCVVTPVVGLFLIWLTVGLGRQVQRIWGAGEPDISDVPECDPLVELALTLAPPTDYSRLRACTDLLAWLLRARNKIISDHLWIARTIARKFQEQAELEDLTQEGVLGLYKALHKFDPEKNLKFSTLAYRAVESVIRDYLDKDRRFRRHESADAIAAGGNESVLGMYASKSRDEAEDEKFFD